MKKKCQKILNVTYSAYPYCALHELGWFRLLTWNSSEKTRMFTEKQNHVLTTEQRETLLLWCGLNGVDYDELVKNIND